MLLGRGGETLNGRGPKSLNFPDGKIKHAKTFLVVLVKRVCAVFVISSPFYGDIIILA